MRESFTLTLGGLLRLAVLPLNANLAHAGVGSALQLREALPDKVDVDQILGLLERRVLDCLLLELELLRGGQCVVPGHCGAFDSSAFIVDQKHGKGANPDTARTEKQGRNAQHEQFSHTLQYYTVFTLCVCVCVCVRRQNEAMLDI
jgi:hypothetical protein